MKKITFIRLAFTLGAGSIIIWVLTVLGKNNLILDAPWFRQCISYARLAGILLAFIFLFELLTMSRWPLWDDVMPKPFSVTIHKFLGFSAISLLLLHLGLMLPGKAALHKTTQLEYLQKLLLTRIGGFTALGLALLLLIWITSILLIAKKISFKHWRECHLMTYAALLFLFFHQILWGNDFQSSPLLTLFWSVIFATMMIIAIGCNAYYAKQKYLAGQNSQASI